MVAVVEAEMIIILMSLVGQLQRMKRVVVVGVEEIIKDQIRGIIKDQILGIKSIITEVEGNEV